VVEDIDVENMPVNEETKKTWLEYCKNDVNIMIVCMLSWPRFNDECRWVPLILQQRLSSDLSEVLLQVAS